MYEHLLSKWVYTGVRARYLWAKVIISCSGFQIGDGGSCSRGGRRAGGQYADFWGMESREKGNVGGKENSLPFPPLYPSVGHVMRPGDRRPEPRKAQNSGHICFSLNTLLFKVIKLSLVLGKDNKTAFPINIQMEKKNYKWRSLSSFLHHLIP